MNRITDHEWEVQGIDGAIRNDWYIVPVAILFGIAGVIALVGADNFIEVMSEFIGGIKN